MYSQKSVFCADYDKNIIKQIWLNGTRTNVITTDMHSQLAIACDWIGNKLYWVDGENKNIKVGNLDGSIEMILFHENIGRLRAIALDPTNGLVFQ